MLLTVWESFHDRSLGGVCMFFFYPIKEEIPQTSDCRDILSLSKDWAFELLLGKRSASPAFDWTQLTEDWRSIKGKPKPWSVEWAAPTWTLGNHLRPKSWCGAVLGKEPDPNPAEVTGKSSTLFGGPQSVQRERTRQCWSWAGKGLWQSWGGSGEGGRGHPNPPLPPCPGRASRATWNAALQSFPLNSLKLLDGKRQCSCFHYYFLSPFARWFLFWGDAFKQRSGWIFKGISGKDLWASRW